MASTKETALELLKTNLANISGIVTVIRQPGDLELRKYTVAQFPLVHIKDPVPNLTIQPGMQLLSKDDLTLRLYYVDWTESGTIYQGWVEKLVEGITTVPTSSVAFDLNDTKSELLPVDFPLVCIGLNFIMTTYSSQANY